MAAPGVADAGQRDSIFAASNGSLDAADLYMFRSYETGRQDFVTLIADYYPGDNRTGGALYHQFEPGAVYEISIDSNGNGKEDMTFQLRPKPALANSGNGIDLSVGPPGTAKDVPIPFIAAGPLTAGDESQRNLRETYSLKVVRGDRRKGTPKAIEDASNLSKTFSIPLDNVGDQTIANYPTYSAAGVHPINIPGCETEGRVFVGQRDDPYAGSDGYFYDLFSYDLDAGTDDPNPVGPMDQGADVHSGRTVQSMALEVPTDCLVKDSPTIGAWASASLPNTRVLSSKPSLTSAGKLKGALQQVARVGSPLVNNWVIGLPDKQRYNAGAPKNDAAFMDYFTNPTFPEIIELRFIGAGVQAPNNFPRNDLVSVFLTGIPAVNNTGTKRAEMLRLNTNAPPTAPASQDPLGMLHCFDPGGVLDTGNGGCDQAGYPNGRRPGDDAVDILWRIEMGYLVPNAQAPSGSLPFTDGAFASPSSYASTFPYLNTPSPAH